MEKDFIRETINSTKDISFLKQLISFIDIDIDNINRNVNKVINEQIAKSIGVTLEEYNQTSLELSNSLKELAEKRIKILEENDK